jgi:hypothetical protein
MGFLTDSDAERASRLSASSTPQDLARWLRALLEDRAQRVALIQRLSRHIHYLRRRQKQAAEYLDKVAAAAHAESMRPWPNKLPCAVCGAAPDHLSADLKGDARHGAAGHQLVTYHPDGTVCRQRDAPPAAGSGKSDRGEG